MLVKHLIRELQKCDAEAEVFIYGDDGDLPTYGVERIKRGVLISARWAEDDNTQDTPTPLESEDGTS